MSLQIREEQWSYLREQFSLHRFENNVACDSAILASDLLHPQRCEAYLDTLGAYIGSPNRRVTASTLAKRYAHIVITPLLYMFSSYNLNLAVSLDQLRLEIPSDPMLRPHGTRLPRAAILTHSPLVSLSSTREDERDAAFEALFAQHITPLFTLLAKTARLSPKILWENAVVRIVPMYEDAYEQAIDASDRGTADRVMKDYQALFNTHSSAYFGTTSNPLFPFIEQLDQDDGLTQITRPIQRKTCCLYYFISDEYCRACPLPAR